MPQGLSNFCANNLSMPHIPVHSTSSIVTSFFPVALLLYFNNRSYNLFLQIMSWQTGFYFLISCVNISHPSAIYEKVSFITSRKVIYGK